MRSIELFAGGGGLALGTHLAGFTTEVVAEWDHWCCDTLRENQASGHPLVQGLDVREEDVHEIDWAGFEGRIDVVSGGPPCQPFSGGGKGMAHGDHRDMFPVTADVIRSVRPKAFIIENVRGLTRSRFADYYSYVQLRLAHPDLSPRDGETWGEHFMRLQAEHTSVRSDTSYHVVSTVVNAADYGVPQQRWRVFIVGFRSDVDAEWSFPGPTHSAAALRISQQVTGEYWDRHRVPPKNRPQLATPPRLLEVPSGMRPWRTVRDAIGDLPEPTERGSRIFLNHVLQPGARSYRGHTGSFIDEPAKALKAGVHGVPGGENMLRRPDSVRYFTVREAVRLQTFPDRYALHGPWSEALNELSSTF